MPTEMSADWDTVRILNETFVASVETHVQLPSTNTRGLELARAENQKLPHLVIADRQTGGRGRGSNVWWASAGSLTFSLVLQVTAGQLPTSRWPELSLTVGSSICTALLRLLPHEDIRLKWPNDVYLRGRKVCGVLVEVPSTVRERVVIGVGINVQNSIDGAPAELADKAIALCDAGSRVSRQDVLVEVLQQFEREFGLLSENPEVVRSQWRRFDLLLGRTLTLADGINQITGTCEGIDDNGALLIRTEAGTRQCYGGVVQSFDT